MVRTSTSVAYIIQPFWSLEPGFRRGEPKRLASEPQALRYAEQRARTCGGVAVFAVETAEDVDYCGEPRIIATFGQVPDLAA